MTELEDSLTQVFRMSLGALQSYLCWLYTGAIEDNPYLEQVKEYGYFFYATKEAHLTMLFISLDALFDDKERLINFTQMLKLAHPHLQQEHREQTERNLESLQKQAKGIGIIRNNSFAHITDRETRIKMGEKYGPSNGELLHLCFNAYELVRKVIVALNLQHLISEMPIVNADEIIKASMNDIERLFAKLGQKN